MLQSPLGWLFRTVSAELNKDAGCQFLVRCAGEDYGPNLQDALGDEYRLEHEAFLNFIPHDQLSSPKFLDNGGNGDVWSALWNRPESLEWGPAKILPVALKKIPQGDLSRQMALKKFVHEVHYGHTCLTFLDAIGLFGIERHP